MDYGNLEYADGDGGVASDFEGLAVQDDDEALSYRQPVAAKSDSMKAPAFNKPRWGDELEEDDGDMDFPLPPAVIIGPDENGVKKVIEYKYNEEGQRVKVTTTFKVKKVRQRKPNKRVQARRGWKKFGDAVKEVAALTTISREQVFLERPGIPGAKKDEDSELLAALGDGKGSGTLMLCRICGKKGDHWTAKCPFKDLGVFSADGSIDKPTTDDNNKPSASAGGGKTAYVPPGLRDKPAGADRGAGERSGGDFARRRNDENSVRVTNLSEDTREADLHELFRPFGPISRVYVAIDQKTGSSRGFGFVNFMSHEDAQKAINKLNGYGYDNLILRVEWAGPRSN